MSFSEENVSSMGKAPNFLKSKKDGLTETADFIQSHQLQLIRMLFLHPKEKFLMLIFNLS
jgi:hypothetical protein